MRRIQRIIWASGRLKNCRIYSTNVQLQLADFERFVFQNQKAFFFDFEAEEKRLREIIEAERISRQRQVDDNLRAKFFYFWMETEPSSDESPETSARWADLKAEFAIRGIEVLRDNWSFKGMMNGLLSAKLGGPVVWMFKTLIEVAHHLADRYPEHLLAFGYAIKHFDALDGLGRQKLLQEQDKSKKWARKQAEIREKLATRDSEYIPDKRILPSLVFLFPEIGQRVQTYFAR